MQCPSCQHSQDNEITCESCGIYFDKWRRREEELKQVKTIIYSEPSHSFRNFGLGALAASLILFTLHKLGSDEKATESETQPVPVAATTQPNNQGTTPSANAPIANNGAAKPVSDPAQKAANAISLNAYRAELRNLRNQQSQLQRDLYAVQRNYPNRNWSGIDEAQAHADQMNRQQREQDLNSQIDAVNYQINFLMSHPPDAP